VSDNTLNALRLTLHGRLVGYVVGFGNGRNVFSFADEFRTDNPRPTFSLMTHPRFPRSKEVMAEPWVRHHRLHPSLSNLFPEGDSSPFSSL
jgi:serine/threonine-protein kinase HipA